MQETPVQSDSEAKGKHNAAFESASDKMLEGQTYGESMGGLAILNQPEDEFRSSLKSIDNHLGRQVEIVNEALDLWFGKGQVPQVLCMDFG